MHSSQLKQGLLVKFYFHASHRLLGDEESHSHQWLLKVKISGEPKGGKILDLVAFRNSINNALRDLEGSSLNFNARVNQAVRDAPTCESLCQYFWQRVQCMLYDHYLESNPTVKLQSIQVGIVDSNDEELGLSYLELLN